MDNLDEFKGLLKENLEISKKIYADIEKIRKYLFWVRIFKSVRWLVIIIALVAGFIYSKPYLEQLFSLYKSILPIIPK